MVSARARCPAARAKAPASIPGPARRASGAGLREAFEERRRLALAPAGAQNLQPLAVAALAPAQPLAEQRLKAGEPLEAEALRKADERRGLHVGGGRDARHRAEGDVVRVMERVFGDLAQALGQLVLALEEVGLQRLETGRSPSVSLVSMKPALCIGNPQANRGRWILRGISVPEASGHIFTVRERASMREGEAMRRAKPCPD